MALALQPGDTIAALASAPGVSPRALIRVSGPQAAEIVRAWTGQDPPAPRRLTPARLLDPPIPALLAWFAGPRSFTGQDVAELQLPGRPELADRVLATALRASARPAEPGEFTYRAVLAGKLTPLEAESLGAAIGAESLGALRAADRLRRGGLTRPVQAAMAELTRLRALVEAGIDFAEEEDVHPIGPSDLAQRLGALSQRLQTLATPQAPAAVRDGKPRVVLIGQAGAGKSALFNRLLETHRAVVDAEPGTTRDAVEAPLTLRASQRKPAGSGENNAVLVDTAGWSGPGHALDRKALAATRRAMRNAAVLVWCYPFDPAWPKAPSRSSLPDDVQRAAPPDAGWVYTHTQIDKADPSRIADMDEPDASWLPVSSRTGQGVAALRVALGKALQASTAGQAASRADLLVLPRHRRALQDAADRLGQTAAPLAQIDGPALPDPELHAQRLLEACSCLEQIVGAVLPDDVLGEVFAGFCVGK
ncbi:MAG: GTPase [Planctomycetota bacterium]